jgi:hypothetical protein
MAQVFAMFKISSFFCGTIPLTVPQRCKFEFKHIFININTICHFEQTESETEFKNVGDLHLLTGQFGLVKPHQDG